MLYTSTAKTANSEVTINASTTNMCVLLSSAQILLLLPFVLLRMIIGDAVVSVMVDDESVAGYHGDVGGRKQQ